MGRICFEDNPWSPSLKQHLNILPNRHGHLPCTWRIPSTTVKMCSVSYESVAGVQTHKKFGDTLTMTQSLQWFWWGTLCDANLREAFTLGQVKTSLPYSVVWPAWYTSKTATYLASDLVTVYSNHKMLGIRLVSRTRKYSEIGLSNEKKGHPKNTWLEKT